MPIDAGVYGLFGRPTTELLDPFEIARRRLSIQNALAAQQIQQQQLQTGALGLENAQRDAAAEAQFRAQFMTPAAPGVAAVPNALAPAAAIAGPGPGSAAWSPAAASVLPAPGGMPVNGAPGADSGPGAMLASPAPGAAPGATKTPAGVTLGDIPDSAFYQAFGSKAPGMIKARDEAAAAVATRQQKLGEVREQDQKFWGMLAGGWEHGNYDPRMIPGMLQIAAGHGLQGTPEFQQFAQLAQANDLDGLKRMASLAITPDIRKTISESGAADALTAGRNTENTQKNVQNASAFLSTVRDQGAWDKYLGALTKDDPAAAAKFADIPWSKDAPKIAQQRGMTSQEQVTTAEAAKRDEQTARHENQMAGLEGQRLQLELKRYEQQFGDPTKDATPQEIATAKMRARGDLPLPSPRTKGYDRAVALAAAVDDTGNFAQFAGTRYQTKADFRNKGDSDKLVSITTALGHLDRALTNSAALGFEPSIHSNLTPVQHAYNQDILNTSDEIGRLIKNGVVPEGETNRMLDNLKSVFQSNRDAGLHELKDLLGGKLEGVFQKYKNGTGQAIPASMFNADTQKRLKEQKLDRGIDFGEAAPTAAAPGSPAPGGAPTAAAPPAAAAPALRLPAGSVSVTDPAGGTHYFPNKAAADEFKRLANIRD